MEPDGPLDSLPWELTRPLCNDERRTIQGLSPGLISRVLLERPGTTMLAWFSECRAHQF